MNIESPEATTVTKETTDPRLVKFIKGIGGKPMSAVEKLRFDDLVSHNPYRLMAGSVLMVADGGVLSVYAKNGHGKPFLALAVAEIEEENEAKGVGHAETKADV